MKLSKDLTEKILRFVQDEVGVNSDFDNLKICDLYKFFLVENGCHIKAFGHNFYCESVDDFFSNHLIKFPFESIKGFPDHEKHIYDELEFQCVMSEEKSFIHNVYDFTYIPYFSFIQREKYSSYMLIVEQNEIKELKKFISLCKLNDINESMCAFECLKMMDNILLKKDLDKKLIQKNNKKEILKI